MCQTFPCFPDDTAAFTDLLAPAVLPLPRDGKTARYVPDPGPTNSRRSEPDKQLLQSLHRQLTAIVSETSRGPSLTAGPGSCSPSVRTGGWAWPATPTPNQELPGAPAARQRAGPDWQLRHKSEQKAFTFRTSDHTARKKKGKPQLGTPGHPTNRPAEQRVRAAEFIDYAYRDTGPLGASGGVPLFHCSSTSRGNPSTARDSPR